MVSPGTSGVTSWGPFTTAIPAVSVELEKREGREGRPEVGVSGKGRKQSPVMEVSSGPILWSMYAFSHPCRDRDKVIVVVATFWGAMSVEPT